MVQLPGNSLEAYRDTYRVTIEARRVAELLTFNPQLPRSLRSCFDEIDHILTALPQESGRQARRLAAVIRAGLAHGDLEDVHRVGLRAFLDQFLSENNSLGAALHSGYMEMR